MTERDPPREQPKSLLQAVLDPEKGSYLAIEQMVDGACELQRRNGYFVDPDVQFSSATPDQAIAYCESTFHVRREAWSKADFIGSPLTMVDVFHGIFSNGLNGNESCAATRLALEYVFLDHTGLPILPVRTRAVPSWRVIAYDFLEELHWDCGDCTLFDVRYGNNYDFVCDVAAHHEIIEKSEEFGRVLKEFVAAAKVSRYWKD